MRMEAIAVVRCAFSPNCVSFEFDHAGSLPSAVGGLANSGRVEGM